MTEGYVTVYCLNDRCATYRKTTRRRHIGAREAGRGGTWQCSTCNQWTTHAPVVVLEVVVA